MVRSRVVRGWTVSDALIAGAMVAVPAMAAFAMLAWRWPALAICLVPVSFPVQQLDLPGLPVPAVHLATAAAVALVAVRRRAARQPLVASSAILFTAGLVTLSALVSTVVSADPQAALRLDAGYLLGLVLAGATMVACPEARSLRLVIAATCVVGTVIGAAGLRSVSDLRAHFGGSVVDNRATGFFGQPNELGTFEAVLVVLSFGLFFSARTLWPRVAALVSVVVSLGALVFSLSRGSWIGLGLGLAVFLVLAPRARLPVLGAAGTALAAAAAAAVTLPGSPMLSIVVERAASLVAGQRNPYDDRPAIWAEALRQIALRPVLGSGPGGYPAIAVYRPSAVSTVAPDHAHDLFLTVFAEQGLLGLGALAAAVTVAVVGVVRAVAWHESWPGWGWATRRPEHSERAMLASVAGALAAVLGEGLLDYPLRNAVLATTVWMLVGLLAAAVSHRRQLGGGNPSAPARLRRGVQVEAADGSEWVYPVRPYVSRRLDA